MPKSVTAQDLWNAGMQQCMIFVTALNIATNGFFWWYLPTFISRFHESITDLESNSGIDLTEYPSSGSSGRIRLSKKTCYFNISLSSSVSSRTRMMHNARRTGDIPRLAIMANDIFFQFEHHFVDEFIGCR